MKLTPLDIKRHSFEKGFRGYDPAEVDGFLKQVADQLESIQEELRLAHERTRETEGKLQHYERVEMALQEALESAKASAQRSEEDAARRAALIIEEAELRAEQVLRDSERERFGMRQDLVRLSSRQAEVAARLRGFLLSELEVLSDFQGNDSRGLLQVEGDPLLIRAGDGDGDDGAAAETDGDAAADAETTPHTPDASANADPASEVEEASPDATETAADAPANLIADDAAAEPAAQSAEPEAAPYPAPSAFAAPAAFETTSVSTPSEASTRTGRTTSRAE